MFMLYIILIIISIINKELLLYLYCFKYLYNLFLIIKRLFFILLKVLYFVYIIHF